MELFKVNCKIIALKIEIFLRTIFLQCFKAFDNAHLNFLKFVRKYFNYE